MNRHRIRILHLIGSLGRGGAEMVVINLCNNMDLSKFELMICSLSDNVPLAERLTKPGQVVVKTCGCLPSPIGKIKILRGAAVELMNLVRVVRKFRPHVIHSHLWSYDRLFPWLASMGRNIKHVVTIHNTGKRYEVTKDIKRNLYRWAEALNVRLCEAEVISISKAVDLVARRALYVPSGRLHLIHNGIDTKAFCRSACSPTPRASLGCSDDDVFVVCMGRFYEQKGHKYLIQAWSHVVSAVPEARLLLVGDGPLRGSIEADAKRLSLQKSVQFLGHRDDVRELLASSDLGVFPSLWEGLPVATVEMMAMELPVVGSNISPLVEVIDPPRGGLVVPPRNPEALADALVRLLEDKDLRLEMGRAGRKRAAKMFSVEKQAEKHEVLYENLVSMR